jgi:hypothetical protein
MIRTTLLLLALTTGVTATTGATAQTLDVIAMPGGNDLTITVDSETGQQALMAGDQALLVAATITGDLVVEDAAGEPIGVVIFAESGEPGCAPSPYVVALEFGLPWPQGPLGIACLPYVATARPGIVTFISPPDLAQDGDLMAFTPDDGPVRLGALSYTPQETRGWDALDAEVGGYSDMRSLDLYAAQPVYDALAGLWNEELFNFAQHLRTRSIPVMDGNMLYQSGCMPGQCAFAIGLLAVDPGQERVYSAFFNEGAPDIRPPLEEWSDDATALFERWRAGELQ